MKSLTMTQGKHGAEARTKWPSWPLHQPDRVNVGAAGDPAVTGCASAHADSDGPHGPGLAEGKAADQHCSKDEVGRQRVADLHSESWGYVQWLGAVCAFSAAAALALYLLTPA